MNLADLEPDRVLCGACGKWTRSFRKDESGQFAADESPWLCDPACADQEPPRCQICELKNAATTRPSLAAPGVSLMVCASCSRTYDFLAAERSVA